MKNSIYISGIISAVGLTVGAMFKIQHWPAAGILLMVFIIFFALVFLPLALWNNYKEEKKNTYLFISIFATLIICFASALFKILHWPGAGVMILIGMLAPFILFLPAYIFYYNEITNKDITNFIAILFLLAFFALMDAFLAVRVSKNIIDYAVLMNQTTTQTTKVLEAKNDWMHENLPPSHSDILNAQQTADLKTRTDELCNLIDEMRLSLVKAANIKNEFSISETGYINSRQLSGKDNTALATTILLNTGKALVLKNQIKNYRNYIKSLNLKNVSSDLDEILNVEDIQHKDYQESWESIQFDGPIMVCALQKLDMIKMKVKLVEYEVLASGFSPGLEI